jgi:hypothetical protein
MPITIYLDGYKPDPETKRVMGVAFEAARIALRLADRGDAFAPIVAKKIIELAKEGERNPDLLCERALKDLREPPLRSGGFLWRRLSNSSATDRGERPERYVEPFRLDTMPSRPSLHACLNTVSLRNDPLEGRKATLEMILAKARPASGSTSTWKATARPSSPTPARWGSKVIASKRKDSTYRSGRSPDWLKMKNADAPAVKREEEEPISDREPRSE